LDSNLFVASSKGTVVCGLFSFIFVSLLVVFPGYDISKRLNPVSKGPRPYKILTVEEPQKNHFSFKFTKRENIYQNIILEVSNRHQVDPALVKAIIMAESSYNPRAISKKGAIGLMQIMPTTAGDLGVNDLFNPAHNVDAGVRYIKKLLKQFDGDLRLALAAYNAGSKKVRKYRGIPPYKTTKQYIKKVFEYYQFYQGKEKIPPEVEAYSNEKA
jgi:soluble lytic murein transglycosylase-like protein